MPFIIISAATALSTCLVLYLLKVIYVSLASPIRFIPGPSSRNIILGNTSQIVNVHASLRWFKDYGPTVAATGPFGEPVILTTDVKAIHHILNHTDSYEKSQNVRFILSRVVTEGGLAVVEGQQHRKLRRIMNPAFAPQQLRSLVSVVHEEGDFLRERLDLASLKGPIDMTQVFAESTMQILGLCGFDYDFRQQSQELASLFSKVFRSSQSIKIDIGAFLRWVPGLNRISLPKIKLNWTTLQAFFPILRCLPNPSDSDIHRAITEMNRIGNQLLRRTKWETEKLAETGKLRFKASFLRRDILSLLIRANLAEDLRQDQRLTDNEVLAQIPTFIVAGSETSSTSLSWVIYALCKHPETQRKLRAELFTIETSKPTIDQLNSLPYLDCVLREALRIFAPAGQTSRVATKNDVIPLGVPICDKNRERHECLRVSKGQTIIIHILGVNTREDIWGKDACEFRPERWEEGIPEAASSVPGVWGNILTFIGGPRSCIGYRFSLIVAKTLLFSLIRNFEFELAVPANSVVPWPTVIRRPSVLGDKNGANKLPVVVRPIRDKDPDSNSNLP